MPSGQAQKIEELFRVHDWEVIEVKYGRKLQDCFRRPSGALLRERIDLMTNDEYQSLLRLSDGATIKKRLAQKNGQIDRELMRLLQDYPSDEVHRLLADLGGHDLTMLLDAYERADRVRGKPVVIIAYTIKGWRLPIAGDPLNHSMLLDDPANAVAARASSVCPKASHLTVSHRALKRPTISSLAGRSSPIAANRCWPRA